VLIEVKVVPGASRDKVVGLLGDAIKLQINRPPSRGQANDRVINLLAKTLMIRAIQ